MTMPTVPVYVPPPGPCVNGPNGSVFLQPQSVDGPARAVCGTCQHDSHPQFGCTACRNDYRLTRIEARIGIPSPSGPNGYIST